MESEDTYQRKRALGINSELLEGHSRHFLKGGYSLSHRCTNTCIKKPNLLSTRYVVERFMRYGFSTLGLIRKDLIRYLYWMYQLVTAV